VAASGREQQAALVVQGHASAIVQDEGVVETGPVSTSEADEQAA
jgi:hypothetical protein